MSDAGGREASPPFNPVYDQLAGDGELDGMVAYAIYKKAKREWIAKNNPGAAERAAYHQVVTPTQLELYRSDARAKLAAYAERILDASAPSFRQEGANAEIVVEVRNANAETLKEVKRQQDWKVNLGINLLASLAFTFLVFLFGLVFFSPSVQDFLRSSTPPAPSSQQQTAPK